MLTKLEKPVALKSDVRHLVIQSLTGTSNQIHDVGAYIEPASNVVAFGLRRIGRLTDDDTRFMLTLASHQIGRPAREGKLLADFTGAPDQDEQQ